MALTHTHALSLTPHTPPLGPLPHPFTPLPLGLFLTHTLRVGQIRTPLNIVGVGADVLSKVRVICYG